MYDTLTNDANAFIDAKDQTAATAASQKLYADAKTAEESYPTPRIIQRMTTGAVR